MRRLARKPAGDGRLDGANVLVARHLLGDRHRQAEDVAIGQPAQRGVALADTRRGLAGGVDDEQDRGRVLRAGGDGRAGGDEQGRRQGGRSEQV